MAQRHGGVDGTQQLLQQRLNGCCAGGAGTVLRDTNHISSSSLDFNPNPRRCLHTTSDGMLTGTYLGERGRHLQLHCVQVGHHPAHFDLVHTFFHEKIQLEGRPTEQDQI